MNSRAFTLSIVMAAFAVFFVQSYVESIEEEGRKKFGTEVVVLRAKKDIKEYETINETMLEPALVPKNFLEPSSVFFATNDKESKEVLRNLKSLAGTIAIVPIQKGEQIATNKVTEPNMRTGLSPQITPGKRALAIPVTEQSGVGKLIKPGDRIDLIAVLAVGQEKDAKVSRTVLQDVVVLSVGKAVTNNVARSVEVDPISGTQRVKNLNEDTSYSTVTVELEPGQVQGMVLIMANPDNQILVSLRNNDDVDRTSLGTTSYGDILGPDALRFQRSVAGQRR